MSNCIFNDVTKCVGSSSEHIIQKGLGGRHESGHVLCDSCNHFFGDKLDPGQFVKTQSFIKGQQVQRYCEVSANHCCD
jgi:hypothetical protein